MLQLRANEQLRVIFQRLIKTMGVSVDWKDMFIVINNNLILLGKVRSLFFSFDNKKVTTNIIDITVDETAVVPVEDNVMLTNVLNMTLYVFGKWGSISGLKVEKDYAQLNQLFRNILKEVNLEPSYQDTSFRFFKKGIRITYEDVLHEVIEWSKKEVPDEETEEEKKLGLWHSVCWKPDKQTFSRAGQIAREDGKARMGHNFYPVNYLCPECSQRLYMVLYPVDEEYLIETSEGRVYMARAYTCRSCQRFYTPRPGRLLREGDIYTLVFDDDKDAYDDYVELLGENGSRESNYKLNEFEWERKKRKKQIEESLEQIASAMEAMSEEELAKLQDKMEEGFFPKRDVDQYYREVQNAIREKKWIKEKQKKAEIEKEKIKKDKPGRKRPENENKTSFARSNGKVYLSSGWKRRLYKDMEEEKAGEDKKPGQGEKDLERQPFCNREEKLLPEENKAIRRFFMRKLKERRNKNPDIRHNPDTEAPAEQKALLADGEQDKTAKDKLLGEAGPVREKIQVKDRYQEKKEIKEIKEEKPPAYPKEALKTTKSGEPLPVKKKTEETRTALNKNRAEKKAEPVKMPSREKRIREREAEEDNNIREKEEINALIEQTDHTDRKELYQLYNTLKAKDFAGENVAPALEQIYQQIYDLDKAEIDRICPDVEALSFEEGMKVYERIEEGLYLPELKTNTLDIIDKRLKKLKMDESGQLMRKLKRELEESMEDLSRLYFCEMREIIQNKEGKEAYIVTRALNSYGLERGKYEYPVLVCDSSYFSSGREGFMLTPDHIFYKSLFGSGFVDVMDIEEITSESGMVNKGLYINQEEGGRIKLPSGIPKTEWEAFSEALSIFIEYLKEKPESRSVSYLAEESHEVKCCYRCGFTYQGGNVCPNCGSKSNN